MKFKYGVRPYIQKRQMCKENTSEAFQWKRIDNMYLGGYTSFGSTPFKTLNEAIKVAETTDDAGGITFQNNRYTLRVGNKLGEKNNTVSWIKI